VTSEPSARRRKHAAALSFALALLAPAGCGAPGPVRCHPVRGRVFYDGKPAAGVQVYLMPTSAPMVPQIPVNPHGVTGPDGRFRLGTYGEGDGAPEGGYQVVLFWPPESTGREEDEVDRLMGWYDAKRSKETAQIKEGDNELPPIRIRAISKPPQASEGVPGRN
jgi:hypothetical protein